MSPATRTAVIWLDRLHGQYLGLLRGALAADDDTLIQGVASVPPPWEVLSDWDIEKADRVGWRGRGLKTVGEVDEFTWQTWRG